jgi:glycosyltransferase involved in cell wall biosynthesis
MAGKRKVLYVDGNAHIIGGREIFLEDSLFHHRLFTPYVIFTNDGILPQRIKKKGFPRIDTLKAVRLRHLHRTIPSIWKIAGFIRRQQIDVVISHHCHAWIYGGLAARLARVRGVLFAQGIFEPQQSWLANPIERVALKVPADLYLANSAASLASLKMILGEGIPGEVLHLAINLRQFDPNRWDQYLPDLRAELGLSPEQRVVVLSGRIQEWKGQEILIRAAPAVLGRHPQAVFLVVGRPSLESDLRYYRKLRDLVNDLGIGRQVIFTGFREDLPRILSLAEVVVHASIEPEPFGLVVIEGMAMGKPVIATAMGGPLEIIDPGRDGLLVPPGEAPALAAAINALLADRGLSRKMGLRAREKAAEFAIDKTIDRLEVLLEKLLYNPRL